MIKNWKFYYWFVFFLLLLIPATNSFFTSIKSVNNSYISNANQKMFLSRLTYENNRLNRKVKYYKTSEGAKSLVKDRLEMVEDGEVLIKLDR